MKRLTLLFMLVASNAVAQTTTSEAAPSPSPSPMPEPTPMAEATPTPTTHEPLARIRAGADGGFAVFVPGVSYGANFSGRIGAQLKKMWGVYADIGGGFGFGGSISAGTGGGGVSINIADYWRLTAMAEADIGRFFFVSFGPGVCGCTFGGVSQVAMSNGSASQAAWVSAGYFPELTARIGIGIGQGRHKFTMALENMVTFGTMTRVSQNASMSGADQSVRIGNLAVGWAPALVFGWDMR
jgi:hypothetical protein